jgi:N-glycosylase/DNA lyase
VVKLTTIRAPDFDLAMTLDSGQVFHWEKVGNGFVGTIGEHPMYVEQRGDVLKVRMEGGAPATPGPQGPLGRGSQELAPPLVELVKHYFALDHSLAEICASFPDDPIMDTARTFCRGLRIIRQPKWECLATFICSSMKQVAHIRQISQALRKRFGDRRKIENGAGRSQATWTGKPARVDEPGGESINHVVHTFPSPQWLAQSSERELRECALGYRARNLLATARLVASGAADLEAWSLLSDVDLREKLCDFPGVGAKVANCVMLFAYERLRAFPIDVWIERVLKEKYFPRKRKVIPQRLRAFCESYFGEYGGYAQQYLFHHARTALHKSGAARDFSMARARQATRLEMTKRGMPE